MVPGKWQSPWAGLLGQASGRADPASLPALNSGDKAWMSLFLQTTKPRSRAPRSQCSPLQRPCSTWPAGVGHRPQNHWKNAPELKSKKCIYELQLFADAC